ncbi:SWIM zinc finger family protein [Macrococcus sp. EM39E]|uniref:SWIM zinc finger family protein n=1 Tax=Macrococcus animalis TaxID=3395467 RepID=UPI0039BE2F4C
MMHWTEFFKSHIIERGQDYFDMDVVEIRYIDSDSIDTTVYGNEAYDVEINDIGTDDMTMMCDCPHAMDHNYCKHMAATMIMFEDLNSEVPAKRAKKSKNKSSLEPTLIDEDLLLRAVVDQDEVDIRSWVYEICMNDIKLYNKFLKDMDIARVAREAERMKPKLLENYKKDINQMYKSAARQEFIDYRTAMELFREIIAYIEEELPKLVQFPVRAVKLINHALMQFEQYSVDDSAGGFSELIYYANEAVKEIILNADMKEKIEIFKLYKALTLIPTDVVTDVFEDIIYDNFKEEPFLTHKAEKLHQMLKQSDIREYMIEMNLKRLIEVLQLQSVSNKEMMLQLNPYKDYNPVIEYMIEQALAHKQYEHAIELIQQGRKSKYPGVKHQYSWKLLEVYDEIKHPDYLYFLFEYLTKEQPKNYLAYKQLKHSYLKDEWEQIREYVFRKLDHDTLPIYLVEEKLYDRLLEGFENGKFYFSWFLSEKDTLFYHDLKRSLRMYERFLNKIAADASDRKCYRELMGYLKEIKEMQGDEEIAERLERQWRLLYKNRPAMMDELNKVMGKR